jgi:hypothetical protein
MQSPATDPGTPWTLHLERDGTEDFLVIRDAKRKELIRSELFWMPADHEPVPTTLAAVWLMFLAPRLLESLKTLAQQANQDCPAQARGTAFFEALERANLVIAEATRRPV